MHMLMFLSSKYVVEVADSISAETIQRYNNSSTMCDPQTDSYSHGSTEWSKWDSLPLLAVN